MSTTISNTNHAATIRALVKILDEAIRIPGTRFRFGLDAILGLIPGVGDAAGAVMTGFTILTAYRLGAPPAVLLNMVVNLGIDAAVGAIPFLGDIFDFGFKANRRNLDLLERHIQAPQAARRASGGVLIGVLLLLGVFLIGFIWIAASLISWLGSVIV